MNGCTYVCIHANKQTCMYACMDDRPHVCMYAYMHACKGVRMYVCRHVYMYACMHVCTYVSMCVCTYECPYVHTYVGMYVGICMYDAGLPHPPSRPCSQRSRTTGTNANQREGTMENEPHQSRDRGTVCKEKKTILYGNEHVTMTLLLTSGSNHTIHIFVEHTAPHRRGGANQNDHRPHPTAGGGDKARNDDITTNKRQQPYHTSVEHTAPPQAGRGQPKRPQAPLHRGGRGDEAKQDQTGKATRPNKTTTHLTGKGGYHGVGGGFRGPGSRGLGAGRGGGDTMGGGGGGGGSLGPASMYACMAAQGCFATNSLHSSFWSFVRRAGPIKLGSVRFRRGANQDLSR